LKNIEMRAVTKQQSAKATTIRTAERYCGCSVEWWMSTS
jgi:hypothetical protein